MIILTPEQAAGLAAMSFPDAQLRPIELMDGSWALPEAVKADPTYEEAWPALALCPTREVSPEEVVGYEPPED